MFITIKDDTHDNRQQWERDRDELLQKVDDIMVIYQNHLKEYELPHVKEELQQIYGDIAEKLQCIDIKASIACMRSLSLKFIKFRQSPVTWLVCPIEVTLLHGISVSGYILCFE